MNAFEMTFLKKTAALSPRQFLLENSQIIITKKLEYKPKFFPG